jgi:hypothetical protein
MAEDGGGAGGWVSHRASSTLPDRHIRAALCDLLQLGDKEVNKDRLIAVLSRARSLACAQGGPLKRICCNAARRFGLSELDVRTPSGAADRSNRRCLSARDRRLPRARPSRRTRGCSRLTEACRAGVRFHERWRSAPRPAHFMQASADLRVHCRRIEPSLRAPDPVEMRSKACSIRRLNLSCVSRSLSRRSPQLSGKDHGLVALGAAHKFDLEAFLCLAPAIRGGKLSAERLQLNPPARQ